MSAGIDQGTFLDGHESVGELTTLLGHSSLRVRRAAVAALSGREPSETLQGLLGALEDDENAAARGASSDVLLRYGQRVVGALLRALEPEKHRDRTILLLGILGRVPSRQTVDVVIPLAAHADPSVAAAAINCMGALKDPSVIPALLAVLERGERWQSFYAIDALGELGHAAAVNRLVPLVGDPYFRKAVLRALGKIGDEAAIRPLVQGLTEGPRCPDRTALQALNEMVDRSRTVAGRQRLIERIHLELHAVPAERLMAGLIDHSAAGEAESRRQGVRGLGWLGSAQAVKPLVRSLAEPALATVAQEALRQIVAEHAEPVLQAARELPLPADALRRVIESVADTDLAAAEAFFVEGLACEEDEVRQAAAAALADRARPEHLEVLVRTLGDCSPLVAAEAIRGLLSLADASSEQRAEVGERVEGLTTADTPEMRCAALRVVARLGTEGSRETLDEALHDPAASVRRTAVGLLGQDGDPDRLWRLTVALADEDARVREEAVTAVGQLTDERARGVLLSALHDRSLWVRSRAARALGGHPAPEVRAALEEAARGEVLPVRVAAVEALGRQQPDTRGLLSQLAGDPEPEVRRAALRTLGAGESGQPLDLLTVALEDPVWSVRCAAAEGIGAAQQPSGFGYLSRALDRETDAVVRRALLRALFDIDPESALPFLVGGLAEKNVAETAADLLVRGHEMFEDQLRAEWVSGVDPAVREGLAVVLEEVSRREPAAGGSAM